MRKRLSAIVTRARRPDAGGLGHPTTEPLPANAATDTETQRLVAELKDWQITHGSLLKIVRHEEAHTVPAIPIGASIYPTAFPRQCFEDACALQVAFNKLYAAISGDYEWLEGVLRDLITNDSLTSTLWDVLCKARDDRDSHSKHASGHALTMGIFRSDYMLHTPRSTDIQQLPSIKQVELNTFSCAGGTHGNIVADMHRHLVRRAAYARNRAGWKIDGATAMPVNPTLASIIKSLKFAHDAYARNRSADSPATCILMVVQPGNFNICDERPIEYGLWDLEVPVFRVVFGQDFLDETSLYEGRLIYRPQHAQALVPEYEVSVVYMRAGYDEAEYTPAGKTARLLIERCSAIKCPSISSHLSTLKRVQQALTRPGAVERFLDPEDAARVRKTFMSMSTLDQSSQGQQARNIASDPARAVDYVLKPSLEGGGHNIYRNAIPGFLAQTPKEDWSKYVLMEMIEPPPTEATLVSPAGIYDGEVVSELGVFGTCLWRTGNAESDCQGNDSTPMAVHGKGQIEFLLNEQAGWSFKTKSRDVDEMSVAKGYGCFDSPLLIPTEAWLERYGRSVAS